MYKIQWNKLHYPARRRSNLYPRRAETDKRNYKLLHGECPYHARRSEKAGFSVYGGINAPYIWLKVPEGMTSWKFFDQLLYEVNIVSTPGVGFGPSGEGYLRLTAFGQREECQEAMQRLQNWI